LLQRRTIPRLKPLNLQCLVAIDHEHPVYSRFEMLFNEEGDRVNLIGPAHLRGSTLGDLGYRRVRERFEVRTRSRIRENHLAQGASIQAAIRRDNFRAKQLRDLRQQRLAGRDHLTR
jgi:hypothetical protein